MSPMWPLGLLLVACSGEEKIEPSPVGGCYPGFGTLGLSFVMADEFSESLRDRFDDSMELDLVHMEERVDSCEGYRSDSSYVRVASMTHGMDLVTEFMMQAGTACGETTGAIVLSDDPFVGVWCYGLLDPTPVPDCGRVDTAIVVSCMEAE